MFRCFRRWYNWLSWRVLYLLVIAACDQQRQVTHPAVTPQNPLGIPHFSQKEREAPNYGETGKDYFKPLGRRG